MAKQCCSSRIKRFYILLPLLLLFNIAHAEMSDFPSIVKTYNDSNGWKLKVDNEDYFVKGMVWGYTPIGENYSYNLWANTDEQIKKILDYECNLMKKAGVNTIRQFGVIPPQWVEYIYKEHGIMTIVNHLMGRYGYTVAGKWYVWTEYDDQLTRETLIHDFIEMVNKFKDTPGVLAFALGNENNYGLEWSSFEIENLPVGERYKEKARYLYSLYNEAMKEAKKADSNHPYLIVNGDIQYLDIIKEQCIDMDILGVNSYRGVSFTDMWQRVYNEAGFPIMLTEFGSDAFNALTDKEEQEGQAELIKGNWVEIYNKSYGKGEEGNALGGCQFEWRDEWWKYKQTENLDVQDKHASWSNGGYSFDFVHGQNNMNEEWFGICRLAGPNNDGVYEAVPRMAYDVLREVWKIDLYNTTKEDMNQKLNGIDMEYLKMKSNLRTLTKDMDDHKAFKLTGGRLEGDIALSGKSEDVENDGKNGLDFTNGEKLFLDFAFNPTSQINGNFTLNILGNVVDLPMEQYYGKRGETYISVTNEENDNGLQVNSTKEITDNERIEIYSFEASYHADMFDFNAFYHVPRYHWGYEGDFYGLMREATDMDGMDIWNAKAPYGVEFIGKKGLNGLTVVTGPEIYWGANPKAVVKYNFDFLGSKWTFIHSEDFAQADASATATEATEKATRQTAISFENELIPGVKLEAGYLMSGTEKIDEEYSYMDDDEIYKDQIEFKDAQGAKAKLTFSIGAALIDFSANYAGLVADGGAALVERESTMPYSSLGNKMVYEAGMLLPLGNIWLLPRAMYRTNLLEAMESTDAYMDGTAFYPGTTPRNRDSDPFAVLDNRETVSGEFFLTYDPTPASYFYVWDRDKKEDAGLAFSIGGNYTLYKADTDAHLFYYQEGETNAPFGSGLPDVDVWLAKGIFVVNPNPNFKGIINLEAGKQQSTGNPDGDAADFYSLTAKLTFNKKHYISTYVKKDSWGPYDWYRQFNITYPYQYMLDYSILIDNFFDTETSSRIGIKALFRNLDENSPINEGDGRDHDYEFQTGLYYTIEF